MQAISVKNRDFSVGIKGMGYYIPEQVVTNQDLEKTLDTTDEWIQEKIGIKKRHICAPDEAASDLAVKACERALENAGMKAGDIDLIVMTTMQPDHPNPMPAGLVKHRLGAKKAAAFNMSLGGCPDSVYSLITASQFILSGVYRNVLVVNVEAGSKFTDWTDRSICVFFGDGAGAWVLAPVKPGMGIQGFLLGNDGENYDAITIEAGGSRLPLTKELMDQKKQYVKMDGKRVFQFATTVFPESVEAVLKVTGTSKDEVSLFISHQANINIIHESLRRLGVSRERTYTNIDKYGNMTSASVPVAVAEAFEQGKIQTGDTITLSSFGAGLAWATVQVKWAGSDDFLS